MGRMHECHRIQRGAIVGVKGGSSGKTCSFVTIGTSLSRALLPVLLANSPPASDSSFGDGCTNFGYIGFSTTHQVASAPSGDRNRLHLCDHDGSVPSNACATSVGSHKFSCRQESPFQKRRRLEPATSNPSNDLLSDRPVDHSPNSHAIQNSGELNPCDVAVVGS